MFDAEMLVVNWEKKGDLAKLPMVPFVDFPTSKTVSFCTKIMSSRVASTWKAFLRSGRRAPGSIWGNWKLAACNLDSQNPCANKCLSVNSRGPGKEF